MSFTDMFRIFRSACAPNFIPAHSFRAVALPILLAAILSNTSTVRADNGTVPELGTKFRNSISLGGRAIPLPKGEWEVVIGHQKLGFTKGGSPNAKHANLLLVRRQNGTANMAVLIFTNLTGGGGYGWVRNPGICDRKNVHYNKSDKNYNLEESECWQVNQIVNKYTYISKNVTAQKISSFWNAEFGTSTAVALQYVVNDQHDIVRLRYYLLPVRHGFDSSADLKWKSSEWHPEAVREAPDKQRFITAAKAFGEKLFPFVKKGFENDLSGYTADLDFVFQK